MRNKIIIIRLSLILLFCLLYLSGFSSCGAENINAPADPPEPVHACIPPGDLAPSFFDALKSEEYSDLREMVETVLAVCTLAGEVVPCSRRGAEPPAAGILLAGIFSTLGEYAVDEGEIIPGARPGEYGYCSDGMIPESPNRLCTVIRSMDHMILTRNIDGSIVMVEALQYMVPLLVDFLRFVDGELLPEAGHKYDELLVLRRMVRRCDQDDTVALILAVLDYIKPPHGQAALHDLLVVIEHEDLVEFMEALDINGEDEKSGILSVIRILLNQIQRNEFHPSEMEETLEEFLYPWIEQNFPDSTLEEDIRRLMSRLSDILHPDRRPEILGPLRETVRCSTASDPDELLMTAFYELLFRSEIIGLNDFFRTMISLLDIDPEGTVIEAGALLLKTLADDPHTSEAFKHLLRVGFDDKYSRIVVSSAIRILESGALPEIIAIADQFLTACGKSLKH